MLHGELFNHLHVDQFLQNFGILNSFQYWVVSQITTTSSNSNFFHFFPRFTSSDNWGDKHSFLINSFASHSLLAAVYSGIDIARKTSRLMTIATLVTCKDWSIVSHELCIFVFEVNLQRTIEAQFVVVDVDLHLDQLGNEVSL